MIFCAKYYEKIMGFTRHYIEIYGKGIQNTSTWSQGEGSTHMFLFFDTIVTTKISEHNVTRKYWTAHKGHRNIPKKVPKNLKMIHKEKDTLKPPPPAPQKCPPTCSDYKIFAFYKILWENIVELSRN